MRKNILNIYGLGKLRFSATAASALALLFFWLVNFISGQYVLAANVALFMLILLFCIYEMHRSEITGDPAEIVVDEFLGMYALLLFCIPIPGFLQLVLLFVCFRVMDIIKIPPFSWVDKWDWKYAILLDDIFIGLVLGIGFWIWNTFNS